MSTAINNKTVLTIENCLFLSRLNLIKNIPSKYKYVQGIKKDDIIIYRAQIKTHKISKVSWTKHYATEREAAIGVDKWLLENGFPPVNILKPK